jgi:lipopolysaccharide export system protein LptA
MRLTTYNSLLGLVLAAAFAGPARTARADLIDEEPAAEPEDGEKAGTAPAAKPSPAVPGARHPEDPSSPDDMVGGEEAPATGLPEPSPPASVTPKPPGSAKTNSGVLAPKGQKGGKAKKQRPDGEQPVHFESMGAKAFQQKGTLELEKNVIVTQGKMRMEADYAKVFYDEALKDVAKVIAVGNVKMFKIDEDSGEKIQALGDQVTFLNKERRVTMEGNARLWRGADLVRGKKITYEMDTGWIRADRVVGEVHPSAEKASGNLDVDKTDKEKAGATKTGTTKVDGDDAKKAGGKK